MDEDNHNRIILTCKQVSTCLSIKHNCNNRKRTYHDKIYNSESLDENDQRFLCQLCYLKLGVNDRLLEPRSDQPTLENFQENFNNTTKTKICCNIENTLKKNIEIKTTSNTTHPVENTTIRNNDEPQPPSTPCEN